MDWFSRFVVAWQISNTVDGVFCLAALRQALLHGQPGIFNSDQGVQFTVHASSQEPKAADIHISVYGRGRVSDNIFVERLWRTVKYGAIYIKEYATVPVLFTGLSDYFDLYNYKGPPQGLDYSTPADVHSAVEQHEYWSNSRRCKCHIPNPTATSAFPPLAKATLCWCSTPGGG